MALRFKQHPFFNFSTLVLILTNLATIVIAVSQNWEVGTVLFVYWGQIAAIGFFNILRIRAFRKRAAKLMAQKSETAGQTVETIGGHVGSFFAFHYSAFALFYLLFIGLFFSVDWKEGAITSLLFFFNHGFSYLMNRENDIAKITSAARLLFFPYLRTIPMHIIISGAAITASIGTPAVVAFLLLKTVVDVIMHVIEHAFNNFTFDPSK